MLHYVPSRVTLANHNITAAQYTALYLFQGGACRLCSYTPVLVEGKRFELEIDHDPACCPNRKSLSANKNRVSGCGRCVRALLCQGCNIMLGRYESCKGTLCIPVFDEYIERYGANSELVDRNWMLAVPAAVAPLRRVDTGSKRNGPGVYVRD